MKHSTKMSPPGHSPLLAVSAFLVFMSACAAPGMVEDVAEPGTIRAFAGPIPFRSTMPLSLIFPHPSPDKATVLPAESTEMYWNSTYSSLFVGDTNGFETIDVDGEVLRTALGLRQGLGKGVELQVEIPYLHYSGGFLDQTIDNFHDIFGLPDGGRDKAPTDRYSVHYEGSSGPFFSASENGLHLGDIPLTAKVHLMESLSGDFHLAARGSLELPTGNEDSGFGSGRYDAGVGLLAQKSFDPSLTFYLGMDHVFRKSPTSFRGVSAANVTHLSLAAEKAFSSVFSVLVQTDFQTKPLNSADLHEFDRPEWSLSLGVGWLPAESLQIKMFFSEGLTTDNAADFTAGLSVGARF